MFEQHAADAGFFDVRAGDDDAVIAQQHDLMFAQQFRHRDALLGA